MNTKVKGDKIKEGSIPMSALSNDVKYVTGSYDVIAVFDAAGTYPFNFADYYFCKVGNKFVSLSGIGDGRSIQIFNGPPIYIKYEYNGISTCVITDVTGYISKERPVEIVTIKESNDLFIPNTVIKTTPQELSDDDKNQALANLGIDNYIKNFNKKFHLDICYDEMTVDGNLVVDYSGGVTNLIDEIKTFIANCVYYNHVGSTIIYGSKLTCVHMGTNGYINDASLGHTTISNYKNSITNFSLRFGIYDFEGEWSSLIISFDLNGDKLYYSMREL